jgi:predicted RNase H-like HicB family nuclease
LYLNRLDQDARQLEMVVEKAAGTNRRPPDTRSLCRLPGLITYGRTLPEAREMARDAILRHLEGLKKDGERIPDEKNTIQERVRVALSV